MMVRALVGFILVGLSAVAGGPQLGLHFERISGGLATDGFDVQCKTPDQCHVVQLDHGQPQESATVPSKQIKEWIAQFAKSTGTLPAKRSGAVVISVTYILDGKVIRADLTTDDRKAGENPLARAFTTLETKLRETVASNP